MAIKIGTIDVSGVAVGATGIGTVTIGSNVVWQKVLPDPLCFTANESDTGLRIIKTGTPDAASLEYSTDGTTWTPYTFGEYVTLDNIGDKAYFRASGDNDTSFYTDDNNYYRFNSDGLVNVSGNLDTLLNKNGKRHATKQNTYRDFFKATVVKDASQLELPSMTLPNLCYYGMFQNCQYLSAAPELPATTMGASCYRSMFEGCTALASAPSVLPATTTQQYCYSKMFYGCKALTDAPAISATTLTTNCFQNMFPTDTNLSSVSVAFTDWQADVTPTSYWLYQVASTGKFHCPAELSVIRGASNIPTNWAVIPYGYTYLKYADGSGVANESKNIVGQFQTSDITDLYYLRELVLGTNVTSIGNSALFMGPVEKVVIPITVTYIDDYAFNGCSQLTSMTIPASVTGIGINQFDNCTKLKNITFEGKTMAQVQGMTNYPFDLSTGTTIHCTDGDITIS